MNITIDPLRLDCREGVENCTKCLIRYTGEYCDIDVLDDPVMMVLVVIALIISHGASLFFLIWVFAAIVFRVVKQGFELISLVNGCALCMILSIVFRVVEEVDIMGLFTIWDSVQNYIFAGGYLLFTFTAAMLSISVWLNIVSSLKKLKFSQTLKGPYLATVIFTAITAFVFLILMIVGIITDRWSGIIIIQAIILGVLYLVGMIVIIYYLPIFRRASDDIAGRSKKRLEDVNRYIFWFLMVFILVLVSGIADMIIGAIIPTNNPSYIYIHVIHQILSRIFITPVIYLLILIILFGWFKDLSMSTSSTKDSTSRQAKTKSKIVSNKPVDV